MIAIRQLINKCVNEVYLFQWTLMGYMIEGGGSKTMSKAKYWLENFADESKKLLDILTSVIVDYFEMQVEFCVCLFEKVF